MTKYKLIMGIGTLAAAVYFQHINVASAGEALIVIMLTFIWWEIK